MRKILPSLKPNEKSRCTSQKDSCPALKPIETSWLSSCPACEIEGNSLGNFRALPVMTTKFEPMCPCPCLKCNGDMPTSLTNRQLKVTQ